MYQLTDTETEEENEIGFDQLYFDDEDNRLEMGVDFKDFDQGSYQEGEYTADEAMKLYKDLAEGKLLKEGYNLPDSDSTTDQYVNNHWDGILKDILRAHTDLRNSKGGESIPERPSQIDIDAVLDKFSDADDYIDVDPNVYDEDYFDFYDMYIVTQRRDESTKNISDEDYPKGNYDGYTKRDDLDKLSDLAEGAIKVK